MSITTSLMTVARLADEPGLDRDLVSPGVAGFLFTALIAIGVIFLGFDLVRRLRRSKFREEIRLKLEAEILERDAELLERDAGVTAEQAAPETTAAAAAPTSETPDTEVDTDPNVKQ